MIKKILLLLGSLMLFLGCSSPEDYNDYKELHIVNLDKKTKTTLHTSLKEDNIFALDVYISWEVKGKGKLRFYHPPYENFTEVIVEGTINQMYTIDWYTNDILIEYIPVDTVNGGSILLRYKLLVF